MFLAMCFGLQVSAEAQCTKNYPVEKKGESLWSIAHHELGAGHLYPLIAKANGIKAPYRIYLHRTVLTIPIPCEATSRVQPKDPSHHKNDISRPAKIHQDIPATTDVRANITLPSATSPKRSVTPTQLAPETAASANQAAADVAAIKAAETETAAIEEEIAATEQKILATKKRIEETKSKIRILNAKTIEIDAETERIKSETAQLLATGGPQAP
jgi:nucleoid-associated protein YgaU